MSTDAINSNKKEPIPGAKPELGYRARCKITGYEGIVSTRTEYLHNTPRVAIIPTELDKNGKPQSEYAFDETQVEVLSTERISSVPAFPPLEFYFGQRVQDQMSGLTGRVYGVAYYLNGCIRVGVQPSWVEKNAKMPDVEWIPQKSLASVEAETPRQAATKKSKQKTAKTGGPMRDAPSSFGRN